MAPTSSNQPEAAIVVVTLTDETKAETLHVNEQTGNGKYILYKRNVWVKPWIKRRADYGASNTLLKELKNEDPAAYRNILRITGKQSDKLLGMVDEMLLKQDTIMRMAIPEKNETEDLLLAASCFFLLSSSSQVAKTKRKRFWIRPSLKMRESCSINKLLVQLRADDIGLSGEIRSSFKNFLRMSTEDFENLICLVGPAVAKRLTNFRNAISVTERLAITLRFLATGDSYHSLMYLSKISKQSISVIIPEVCKASIDSLSGMYDGQEHTPKLLQCSHTVCLHCLTRIAASQTRDTGSFRCPICRELITIPRGGVSALPPSFLVNQLLDLMSRQRREVIPKCSVHINQELLFCETCDTVFCTLCTGGSHNDSANSCEHTIIPFSIAIKRMSEILLYKANDCISKLSQAQEGVSAELGKLDAAKEACVEKVNETFRNLQELLDHRKQEVLDSVNSICAEKRRVLEEQHSLIENEKNKC
nr:unnamed protein product [Callosobruchus chinensis]